MGGPSVKWGWGWGQTRREVAANRPKQAVEALLASEDQTLTLNLGSGERHSVLEMTSVVMAGHGDSRTATAIATADKAIAARWPA